MPNVGSNSAAFTTLVGRWTCTNNLKFCWYIILKNIDILVWYLMGRPIPSYDYLDGDQRSPDIIGLKKPNINSIIVEGDLIVGSGEG